MKTYVIAAATFLEIVRRPFFWILLLVASTLLAFFAVIPYFTLGEDIKMVKDQGLALIMVTGLVIAIFSASVSIHDEIEGKTAITLLSKPVRRRDFIIGKFSGIMASVFALFVVLGLVFMGVLFYKEGYDAREYAKDYPTYAERLQTMSTMLPGLVLTFLEVTILCALSVAFSTRLPVHFNITACIAIFLLGHVAPRMVQQSQQEKLNEAVVFLAQVFATVLPGLEYFNVGPSISGDVNVPWGQYVLPAFVYCGIYTAIALFLGLLLFEDRDLA